MRKAKDFCFPWEFVVRIFEKQEMMTETDGKEFLWNAQNEIFYLEARNYDINNGRDCFLRCALNEIFYLEARNDDITDGRDLFLRNALNEIFCSPLQLLFARATFLSRCQNWLKQ